MYTVPRYLPALGVIASSLVVQAKQHVIAPDMCAYVSTNIYRLVGITANTIHSIRGDLDVCLCQSSVDGARGFVATNPITQLAANDYEFGVGEDKVINALMYYIASQGSTCTYPENAIPICVEGQPCDFGCSHGFIRVGDSCACPATMNICGGHCQVDYCTNSPERAAYEKALKLKALQATKTSLQKKKKKKGKGAPAPLPEPMPELFDLEARAVENYEFDEDDEHDYEEAPIFERDQMHIFTRDRCRAGQSLCGAWRKGVDEWECLDTRSTLDSCGGCIYPYYLDENPKVGVDCSSLPGVTGVECRNSSCFVHSCAEGYVLSPAMDECIRTH